MKRVFEHLDRVRQKPVHTRRSIAFVISAAFTFLLFTMWWSTWSANDYTSNVPKKKIKEPTLSSAMANTLASGKEGMTDIFRSLQGSLASLASSTEKELEAEAATKKDGSAKTIGSDLDYRVEEITREQ